MRACRTRRSVRRRVWRGRGWVVYHGDALDVRELVDPESCDALITDAPYCSGAATWAGRGRSPAAKYSKACATSPRDFGGDARDERGLVAWSALWSAAALDTMHPGAPIFSFTDWRSSNAFRDGISAGGWHIRGMMVWDKGTSSRPQPDRPRSQCEIIWWGSNGAWSPSHSPGVGPGVIHAPNVQNRAHVAQKPVEVITPLLRYVRPGGRVLDLFAGSGTTGEAALRAGFEVVLIERDAGLAELCATRLSTVSRELSCRS